MSRLSGRDAFVRRSTVRTIVFTNKSARGVEILRQLRDRQIPIEAVIIDVGKRRPEGQVKNVRRTARRIGLLETARFIRKRVQKHVKRFFRRRRQAWRDDAYYRGFADKVYTVENFNGVECQQLLQELEPDLIVLAGSRIIRKAIIRIPTIGILNAHPGLLPRYRGVDVIPWAIYHGDPVGVTIHFVDAGVDTGHIVAQQVVEVSAGDTLNTLAKKANRVAGALMADVVATLMADGHVERMPQAARVLIR